MEETAHSVAHFMAVGAEKRLEDYHFLRNTYETINAQEIQLNRILRMLGEDEISLNWRLDLTPVGRARSRSPYDFDRWANALVLKGSIAYERLRDLEQDNSKNAKPATIPSTTRRVQEMRERRQRLSEQRELPSEPIRSGRGASSSSRLQALAEYETALADSNAKRQRQAEENQSNNLRNKEQDLPERKRERFTTTTTPTVSTDDNNRSYSSSKQYDDESSSRSTRKISTDDGQGRKSGKDRENGSDKLRKSSTERKPEKPADIELISFTVRYQIIPAATTEEGEDNPSVRLICRWASPSSSSAIDYFTIERQSGDNQWSPIGEQIDKSENQTKLDIALSNDDNDGGIQANVLSYFRLKAHLQNGQTFTSKTTDGILIDLEREKKIITPNVEVLSQNSVQLTWEETTNETNKDDDGTNEEKSEELYDIEKKEEEQPEWEKVTEVPVSQQSARIDSLTDAAQCQFRLIPTIPEPEEIAKPSVEHTDVSVDEPIDSEESPAMNVTSSVAPAKKQAESNALNAANSVTSPRKQADADEPPTSDATNSVTSSRKRLDSGESATSNTEDLGASSRKRIDSDKSATSNAPNSVASSRKRVDSGESATSNTEDLDASSRKRIDSDKSATSNTEDLGASSRKRIDSDKSATSNAANSVASSRKRVDSGESATSNTEDLGASSRKRIDSDKSATSNAEDLGASSRKRIDSDKSATSNAPNSVASSRKRVDSGESATSNAEDFGASSEEPVDSEALNTSNAKNPSTPSTKQVKSDESDARTSASQAVSQKEQIDSDESPTFNRKDSAASSKKQVESDASSTFTAKNLPDNSDNEVEVEETAEAENENEEEEEEEEETEVVTVNNVNEWLNSLHVAPTSSNIVEVDISEEGFQNFDRYQIEYTTSDRPDQWKQASDITSDDPHVTIDKLKPGTDYKFRFTPIASDADDTNASQFSLVLDVQMPSARRGRFDKDEKETPAATPPQFSIQKVDPTTVLIEAIVPADEPATFKDTYDVFSKKDTQDADEDEDWAKVGTIDKKHLSATVEDLEENTAYAFKIDNITSPSAGEESTTVQEFKVNTTPAKKYDPSLFLERIEQSLENMVNGVMQAAAGHQAIEAPVNQSLNEVIKEVFRDESLLPSEEFGFDTLALNNDLQVYRGPKQMMIKDLEVDETIDLSKHYGEIIIHNYRTSQQSVIVREENGNTRVNNIDGDIIIRNVVSDVILKNDQTHHQLSMNIVGQAFLKGVQGSLIASKFKGIIVVKNVHKP